jgi:hypothetical protein
MYTIRGTVPPRPACGERIEVRGRAQSGTRGLTHVLFAKEPVRMELENSTLSSPAPSALGYLGDNRIPGAVPQVRHGESVLWRTDRECSVLGAKQIFLCSPTPKAFRRAIGESSALTPHQLRSWKPGSYAAWPSLHVPNASGPLHLGGTGEIPFVLCPRRVKSFAACTYVK